MPKDLDKTVLDDDRRIRIQEVVDDHIRVHGTFPQSRFVRNIVKANSEAVNDVLKALREEYEDRRRFEESGGTYPDWVEQLARDIYRRARREFDRELADQRTAHETQLRILNDQVLTGDARCASFEEQLEDARRENELMQEKLALANALCMARDDADALRRDLQATAAAPKPLRTSLSKTLVRPLVSKLRQGNSRHRAGE